MTTLAGMTPEQRAQCVGMWCYIFDQEVEPPIGEGIIAGYRESDDGRTLVVIDHPHPDAGKWGHDLNEVIPRPELPRAWNPNGTPVEMDVETSIVRDHPRGGMIGSYESPEYVDQPEGTVMRRFVGEWEKA